MSKNTANDDVYRKCLSDIDGNCPHMKLNDQKTPCCSIDKIVQVEFFGCIPAEIFHRKNNN